MICKLMVSCDFLALGAMMNVCVELLVLTRCMPDCLSVSLPIHSSARLCLPTHLLSWLSPLWLVANFYGIFPDAGRKWPPPAWSGQLAGFDGVREWCVASTLTGFQFWGSLHRLDRHQPGRVHHHDAEQEPFGQVDFDPSWIRNDQLYQRPSVSKLYRQTLFR